MKIYQCSPSAIKTYNHCSFKYWLEKRLELESPAGKAALQGTIVHQVFEWMGKLKLRNKTYIDPLWLLDQAWIWHVKLNPKIGIRRTTSRGEAADFKKCRLSVEDVCGGDFDPYTSKIIDIEKWFEFEMPGKEWECKNRDNETQQFTSRGFIDLSREINEDTIEIVDWKTGKRQDFYTMKEHTFETLFNDIQVRLYHLAATILYPQYNNVMVTIYYTTDGGPITIPLTQADILSTIEYLWKLFQTVKSDTLLIRNRSWKCRMCAFERSGICQRVWSDLNTIGEEYVKDRYIKLSFEEQEKIAKSKQKPSREV